MACKSKNMDTKELCDKKISERLTDGKVLYLDILSKVHKDNIKEMFNYIRKNNQRLELYGNTKEQALVNFCAFKPDLVLKYYGGNTL